MQKYHLTAIIDILRHGEKDKEGALTDLGHHQSALRALSAQYLHGDIHLRHSGKSRVYKTAVVFKEYLTKSPFAFENTQLQEEVASKVSSLAKQDITIDEELRKELQYIHDVDAGTPYFKPWNTGLPHDEFLQVRQDYLNFKDSEPMENVQSPEIVAKNVGKLVLEQIQHAKSTPATTRSNYINGTHEPVLLAFLYYALHGFQAGPDTFMQDIKESIWFTEGCQIKVYQTFENDFLITLSFRDFLVEFTEEELISFVE